MKFKSPSPSFFSCALLLFLLFAGTVLVAGDGGHRRHGHHHHHHHGYRGPNTPRRLFVFGDSYADTGNGIRSIVDSWKFPYGITFPGRPSGRFSDGLILTDYIARFLGLRSPITYAWGKWRSYVAVRQGVNFAFGGTGVFDTLAAPMPNMTNQIDLFEEMVHQNGFGHRLGDSVALVSCVGNDYNTFLAQGGSIEDLPNFISKVVNQLATNLQRLRDLGVPKIMVTGLQPLGCLPQITMSTSYANCDATDNSAVAFHNALLQSAVDNLNNRGPAHIVILDLYDHFMKILQQPTRRFKETLKPCCAALTPGASCSDVDENGKKMYEVCREPRRVFFWDSFHPTQAGWEAVFESLKGDLRKELF